MVGRRIKRECQRETETERDRVGEIERETRWERQGWEKERYKERQGWGEKEKETGWEREKDRKIRERETKLRTQENSWNFILSCFIPQKGVKHDYGL